MKSISTCPQKQTLIRLLTSNQVDLQYYNDWKTHLKLCVMESMKNEYI